VADTLDERRALERWFQRQVAVGLALRPDLVALAVAAHGDREKLDAIVTQATEAAATTAKANMGTALHELTERLDRGEPVQAPPSIMADLDAYRKATEAIEWLAVESLVVLDDHLVAGTPDRIGRLPDGRVVIADLKTGSVEYGWRSFAIQLAIYAHASAGYDVATDTRTELPAVDLDGAVVIHLPAGEARCELWHLDIGAGWRAFATAMEVRAWRQRRDLADPLTMQPPAWSLPAQPSPPVDPALLDEHRRRVQALRSSAKIALAELVAQAEAAGFTIRPTLSPTVDVVARHQAAVAVADVLDGNDEVARSAIALVMGAEPQASVPLGAVVGSLTAAEALRLHGLLVELDVGQRHLVLTDTGATFPPIDP
jgi:hypothetical protein